MGAVSASPFWDWLPMFALCRMFMPSAIAPIIPYSMPLWTIFTKCPAPLGPQWRYPCSEVDTSPSRPGVRSAASTPGASEAKTGSTCAKASASPPIIRLYPRSSPHTPPLVPQSRRRIPCLASFFPWRMSSR